MSFDRRRAMVFHLMPERENRFNGNVRNPFLTLEDREVMGVGDALDETRGGGVLHSLISQRLLGSHLSPSQSR